MDEFAAISFRMLLADSPMTAVRDLMADRLDLVNTIDFCQHLLTQKEPQLARAKHIPEWKEYDSEIAHFARQLAESGIIHFGMADADATVLAGVGAAKAVGQETPGSSDSAPDHTGATPQHPKDEL
ncbi:hypothetical protein PsYK624_012550 [Phanerochaete sordida]|uniref:Uncharacterized protein n=1 Tax=Phanerochaete sordida TaxID=48140 RepID=A0A9P3FXU7_9APHY|nr:hypothetical protein PsYK624_012550 [Phanerochaete sordida]